MYKWNAEDYHQNSPNQHKLAKEVISKLVLKGNETILDLGCGDGKITAEIASNLPNGSILGIDSSENMIEFALSKFSQQEFPNLSFQQVDARQLNFDRKFDVVVSFACLHWVKDHLPVLTGVKKSLKPSGKIMLQFGGREVGDVLQSVGDRIISKDRWKNYFYDFNLPFGLYTPEEYKNLLVEVGLKPIRVESIAKDMNHNGKEGLKAWIRTTWHPYTARVPENLHQDLINDLADTYIEMNPADSAGLIHVWLTRLEVEATKG